MCVSLRGGGRWGCIHLQVKLVICNHFFSMLTFGSLSFPISKLPFFGWSLPPLGVDTLYGWSLSLTLFNYVIRFAKEVCAIRYNYISIIMYAGNTLLFSNGEPWVRKDGDQSFAVVMDCYDRAEIYELIGTYLLNQINNVISKESIGLIRDDELLIFKNI